jgi:lysophospholipase L1-like esterase
MIGCIAVVALLCSAAFATVASAKTPLKRTAYIALGDSLSFGYKAATFNANQAANKTACENGTKAAENDETAVALKDKGECEPPWSFEEGFVGVFGHNLAKTEKAAGNELVTVNLGCPGETSSGLIGHFLGGMGEEYDPCAYTNLMPTEGYPLKTQLGGASELEVASSLIASKSDGNVTAVSLQIGSNDELHAVANCESPKWLGEHGFTSLSACLEFEVGPEGYTYAGGVFGHILYNIGASVEVLRGAGYAGTIEILGFYNPDAKLLPGSDALDEALNGALEEEIAGNAYGPGIKLVKVYPLINPDGPRSSGETSKETAKKEKGEEKALCKYTEICSDFDIHPTEKGYAAIGKLMTEAF